LETRRQVMEIASFITDYKNHTLQQLFTEITPKPSAEILQHKQLFLKIVSLRILLNKLIQKKS